MVQVLQTRISPPSTEQLVIGQQCCKVVKQPFLPWHKRWRKLKGISTKKIHNVLWYWGWNYPIPLKLTAAARVVQTGCPPKLSLTTLPSFERQMFIPLFTASPLDYGCCQLQVDLLFHIGLFDTCQVPFKKNCSSCSIQIVLPIKFLSVSCTKILLVHAHVIQFLKFALNQ